MSCGKNQDIEIFFNHRKIITEPKKIVNFYGLFLCDYNNQGYQNTQ